MFFCSWLINSTTWDLLRFTIAPCQLEQIYQCGNKTVRSSDASVTGATRSQLFLERARPVSLFLSSCVHVICPGDYTAILILVKHDNFLFQNDTTSFIKFSLFKSYMYKYMYVYDILLYQPRFREVSFWVFELLNLEIRLIREIQVSTEKCHQGHWRIIRALYIILHDRWYYDIQGDAKKHFIFERVLLYNIILSSHIAY